MTIRISHRMAQVRAELLIEEDDKGSPRPCVQVTVLSRLPRLDSEINQVALDQALQMPSSTPLDYPDCEVLEFKSSHPGDDIGLAVSAALKDFHTQATALFDAAFSRIKMRATTAENTRLEQKKVELQHKFRRKKFGFFGPTVTPNIPKEGVQ